MLDLTLASGTYRGTLARVGQGGMPERRYLWVPPDTYRVNYDATNKNLGWVFNPRGDGPVRQIVRERQMSRPCIYRLFPLHSFMMTAPWLRLLEAINPDIVPEEALSILDDGVAYCNTRTNLLDQIRITSGASVEEVRQDGERVYIKTINANGPVPSAAAVLADPALWHFCTGIQPDGDINLILRRGKDGVKKPVRMLNISAQPVYMLREWLMPLPAGFVPGPQWKPEPR